MGNKSIGENIKRLRKSKKVPVQSMVDALKITRKTLNNWENGIGEPTFSQLKVTAEMLGVTTDELVKGMPAKIISFINSKGGVTKSSLLRQVCMGLLDADAETRVLCLDTDPQQTLMMYANKGLDDRVKVESIDVNSSFMPINKLQKAVGDRMHEYDYILIDTSGYVALTEFISSVIMLSKVVVVPILLNPTSMHPTISSISNVASVRDEMAPHVAVIGVKNKVNLSTKEGKYPFELDGYMGMKMLKSFLTERVQYARDANFADKKVSDEVKDLIKELKAIIED